MQWEKGFVWKIAFTVASATSAHTVKVREGFLKEKTVLSEMYTSESVIISHRSSSHLLETQPVWSRQGNGLWWLLRVYHYSCLLRLSS